MASEIESRPETGTQIFRLVRLGVLCTLALGAALLIIDVLRGPGREPAYLTQTVAQALIYAIAAQVIVAIAAATFMVLWKK
jgi:hypothetical protein